MAFQQAALNVKDPMVDLQRRPTKGFIDWMTSLLSEVESAPSTYAPVSLTGQSASIGTTPIPVATLSSGLYRVTWSARITTPATTGAATSSLTVTLGWTDATLACTISGAALTGNTTTTTQSATQLVRVDAASPITYATTYASNTAGQMVYRLDVVLEAVSV